jgi:hypothetical protein
MVSPKAERYEHDDDGIVNRGVAFGTDVTSKICQMDDDTKALAPGIGGMSIKSSAPDRGRKCFTNASNSCSSSNSGVDSYNADCSGGSDDQSSDDTSGKKKVKNAILMNVSSAVHKCNSGRHIGSAASSCSSDGRNFEATSTLFSKKRDRNGPSTSISPQKSVVSNFYSVDPRIDLSVVNSIPSSALLLPLHETARAALLQCNAHPSTKADKDKIQPPSVLTAEGYHHLLEVTQNCCWCCFWFGMTHSCQFFFLVDSGCSSFLSSTRNFVAWSHILQRFNKPE